MVDFTRHTNPETDDEYLARTFDEGYNELLKVWVAVRCARSTDGSCALCKFYAEENVRNMHKKGMMGEQCLIRLALNHVVEVRNIAKTGKP